MPTFDDKSGIDWSNHKLSDNLTFHFLAEESNITPKENYPLVWYVGNKIVSFSEIEDLYKVAKIRKDQFEAEMAKK